MVSSSPPHPPCRVLCSKLQLGSCWGKACPWSGSWGSQLWGMGFLWMWQRHRGLSGLIEEERTEAESRGDRMSKDSPPSAPRSGGPVSNQTRGPDAQRKKPEEGGEWGEKEEKERDQEGEGVRGEGCGGWRGRRGEGRSPR